MRSTLMLLLGGGAFTGFVLIFIYNSLVAKRNMVRNAFSSIDVNLRKRHDLIPNLVETVKAYASHEKETFTRLIEARQKAGSHDITGKERLRIEEQIGPQVQRVIALAEDYPELRSSDHFLNLQRNLTEVEEQISAARRAYNAAVYEINNAVESFPSNLIANAFGFQRHDFFEAHESARESVKI
jgi:LemA protein